MSEDQALSCFLAGLKYEMEIEVKMFYPKTLQVAYFLAKLQDSLKNDPATIGTMLGRGFRVGSIKVHLLHPYARQIGEQAVPVML